MSTFAEDILGEVGKLVGSVKPSMQSMAAVITERIRKRTLSGRDVQNKGFIDYTEKYKIQKPKRYRVAASPVNLRATGKMWGDFHAFDGNGAIITPSGRGSQIKSGPRSLFTAFDKVVTTIGFTPRSLSEIKAASHITGINRKWKGKYQRNFLGMNKGDLDSGNSVFNRNLYQMKNKSTILRVGFIGV